MTVSARFPMALAALLCVAPDVAAVRHVVDTVADEVDASPGDGACRTAVGTCSLRAAVMEANAVPGTDEIALPAGTFALTRLGANEDLSATGDLDVLDDLVIEGVGRDLTILDGLGAERGIDAPSTMAGGLDLRRVGLTRGGIRGGGASFLRIEDCGFTLCNGAAVIAPVIPGPALLTMVRTSIEACIRGVVVSRDSTADIRECTFRGATRAAVVASEPASLLLEDCHFEANTADVFDAVVRLQGGSLTVVRCRFVDNTATALLVNEEWASATPFLATVVDSEFRRNACLENSLPRGGAILELLNGFLDVRDSLFEENGAGCLDGGAVGLSGGFNAGDDEPSSADFTNCRFVRNSAVVGGAAWVSGHVTPRPEFVFDGCTFEDNQASDHGGAVAVHGDWSRGPRVVFTNSTFSGNTAPRGAAISVAEAPEADAVELVSTTVAFNDTTAGVGAIERVTEEVGAPVTGGAILRNSIVSGNTSGDIALPTTLLDVNVVGEAGSSALTGDLPRLLLGIDPLLLPLALDGGATPTHRPMAGSPVLDAVPAADCVDLDGLPLLVDQRGLPRPADADGDGTPLCDVGAVELDCGPDDDADGLGERCDCAPGDAAARALPVEPTLTIAKVGAAAHLRWNDLVSQAGSGIAYDVASASLADLHARGVADAPCVQVGLALPEWIDSSVGSAYYLVRGVNACGPAALAGWGRDSFGVPRPACP